MAAVRDTAHLTKAIEHNDVWLPKVMAALESIGLTVTPSVGNFVLAHFSGEHGKTAAAADAFLSERNVVVRRMDAYGLPQALRLSIGDEAGCKALIAGLTAFMSGTG